MKLIVGLGNPGPEYADTRHNAGFLVVDAFARRHLLPEWKRERKAMGLITRSKAADEQVILLEPETFMNESGDAVRAALAFFKLEPKDLWLIHDEVAFPLGTVRLAERGSAGGHNGVASVIAALGTEAFLRLRIGVGPKDGRPIRLESYVLERFPDEESEALSKAVIAGTDALDTTLGLGVAAAMQRVNTGE